MKRFEDLTFADHYMFEKVLQNAEICKELLERLLKIQIERLEYPELEKTISPYYESRGVRLDVYVKGSGEVFDIELQNSADLLPLRTRYYQSMLDADNLIKGGHYSELPRSFIIFICTIDPFGAGRPVYTFRSRCDEDTALLLEDRTVRKFFNTTAWQRETDMAIKSLLEYTCNKRPVDDLTKRIDSLVGSIKKKETNRKEYSTLNIHDQDTFRRGKSEGAHEKAVETARNLLLKDIPSGVIAECTALPLEVVEQLRQEILATESQHATESPSPRRS